MEHYAPELTLISAFREVGTVAAKALDLAYISGIKNKAQNVLHFVWNSRNYSESFYGDYIWKYKRNVDSTSYFEEKVVNTAVRNVKKIEESGDVFKVFLEYEKIIESKMKQVTKKYNNRNVKY